MRRKEKHITNRKEMDAIIAASPVCRVAMARDNQPYLVPLSFGYDGHAVYIHTAAVGKKIDFFETNPLVCVEFEHHVQLRAHSSEACKFSFSFECVIAEGTIEELVDAPEKKRGMDLIMRHYADDRSWHYHETLLAKTRVWKINILELNGKRSLA